MGHVPSKEVSAKPFFVDVRTGKGAIDRLIAVSVTKDTFPSVDHPLFQQFVDLRCHPSVRQWFEPEEEEERDRNVLPPAPTAEELYRDHVIAGTDLVEKMSAYPPSALRPSPMALFRFVSAAAAGEDGTGGEDGGGCRHHVPLKAADVCMVGYLNVNASFPCPTLGANTGSGQCFTT